MQISLDLKDNLANRHPRRPMIKATLSLSHSDIVTARVHANVGRYPHVHAELHATQSLPDRLLGNAELVGGDAAVVVAHAQAIVTPYDGGAARAAAGGNAAAAFAGFARLAGFGGEVVEAGGCAGECAGGGCEAAGEGGCCEDCCVLVQLCEASEGAATSRS